MLNSLGVSIVANALFLAGLALLRWVQRFLEKKHPRRGPVLYYGAWGLWFVLNSVALYLVETRPLPAAVLVWTLLPTSVILFWVSWCTTSQFWSVGLRSADRRIDRGIDYRTSLSLVHNELSFLGTGASKLTALTSEFEAALHRCRGDRQIRFLLMKPTDENLTEAARRAKKDKDAYKKQVLESLRRIASVRESGVPNVEVRFYPESQQEWGGIASVFRLMFIDKSLCLMSYNVFGISDGGQPGSQLPQLHLVSFGAEKPATRCFYWAMESFYDRLWEKAEEWDFKEFLGG